METATRTRFALKKAPEIKGFRSKGQKLTNG